MARKDSSPFRVEVSICHAGTICCLVHGECGVFPVECEGAPVPVRMTLRLGRPKSAIGCRFARFMEQRCPGLPCLCMLPPDQ